MLHQIMPGIDDSHLPSRQVQQQTNDDHEQIENLEVYHVVPPASATEEVPDPGIETQARHTGQDRIFRLPPHPVTLAGKDPDPVPGGKNLPE